ncbi:MAG: nuclear transport factor 2 family protein [Hyphomonadaceae bacterium]|nr:nuclear transport factor 2 family protein [Hyphomonadaceae bacterium]
MKLLLLAAAFALSACATAPRSLDGTRAEILALQQRWAEARMAQDAAYLEEFYADDFRVLAMDGNEVSRAEDIANFATKILKPELIANEDMEVRVYGDAAVVTGVERVRGTYRDFPGAFTLRFTNIYVRDGGRWRLAHHHSTPIPERAPPP